MITLFRHPDIFHQQNQLGITPRIDDTQVVAQADLQFKEFELIHQLHQVGRLVQRHIRPVDTAGQVHRIPADILHQGVFILSGGVMRDCIDHFYQFNRPEIKWSFSM